MDLVYLYGPPAVGELTIATEMAAPQTARRFAAVEANGGRVCLVQLSCPEVVLEERVQSPQRVRMRKIATLDLLHRMIDDHDVVTPIPGRDSLRLDTSELGPNEAAGRIIEHYRLPRAQETS